MERKMMKVATAIVFSCCLISIPASQTFAQEGARTETTQNDDDDDNDTDFGWIGLIGLAGLLGLRRKDRDDYRSDSNRPVTPR